MIRSGSAVLVPGVLALGLMLSATASAECTGPASPPGRFVADGAEVHDTQTHLTWARCSVGMQWVDGEGCTGAATRGSFEQANGRAWPNHWRVPSPEELKTIVAGNCEKPAIDEALFPGTVSDWYWTNRQNGPACQAVLFFMGYTNEHGCYVASAVRLVRNGP